MDTKPSVRDRIFQAALARIKHYGFGKTTMAEIAADCGMSPGNIYRFFEAKIDIAEAIVRRHFSAQQTRLAAIARRHDVPADERLRQVLSTRLHENFASVSSDPKVMEIASVVHKERPTIAVEEEAHERVFLSQILREGTESGLFAVEDPDFTAEMIQIATLKFTYSQLFGKSSLARLERELEGVISLILKGIRPVSPNEARVAP